MPADKAVRSIVSATVHGSYWYRPADTDDPAPTLVGFHGYGESAEVHLREIILIPGVTAWNVLAIQALHPFYNTRTGDVVASWMTKLDREEAIADNVRYVTNILLRILAADAESDRPVVLIGFSQGTAMAYRTAALAGCRCDGVVALGGDVPPELVDGALAELPVALIGLGDSDEWYTEARLAQDREILESQGVDCRPMRYHGGHEWTDEFRTLVGRFLDGIRSRG